VLSIQLLQIQNGPGSLTQSDGFGQCSHFTIFAAGMLKISIDRNGVVGRDTKPPVRYPSTLSEDKKSEWELSSFLMTQNRVSQLDFQREVSQWARSVCSICDFSPGVFPLNTALLRCAKNTVPLALKRADWIILVGCVGLNHWRKSSATCEHFPLQFLSIAACQIDS